MKNHIHTLFVGYSKLDEVDDQFMRANCSCTLIKLSNNKNIIVDTMTAWDGNKITEALSKIGLSPADISAVICTHGHSDHIGCNSLFQEAELHIVGNSASYKDRYMIYDWGSSTEDYFEKGFKPFGNDLIVFRTPGHTIQCVSVLVKNSQLAPSVGIAGDLFENVQDIENHKIWLEAGSDDPALQKVSRHRLAEICDFIIPGHGEGFAVTASIRSHLEQQLTQKF